MPQKDAKEIKFQAGLAKLSPALVLLQAPVGQRHTSADVRYSKPPADE
jgi:hypothetical protein